MKKLYIQHGQQLVVLNSSRKLALVGRNPDNNIIVNGDCVSRYHLRLEQREGDYYLTDESQNGTYLYDKSGVLLQFVHRQHFAINDSSCITLGKPLCECGPDDVVNLTLTDEEIVTRSESRTQEEIYDVEPTVAIINQPVGRETIDWHNLEKLLCFLLREQGRVLIVTDESLFLRYYTAELAAILKRPLLENLGKDLLNLIHREERQEFFDLCQQVLLQGTAHDTVLRIATSDPQWDSYRFKIYPNYKIGISFNGICLVGARKGSAGERNNYLDNRYELKRLLQSSNFASTYLGADHGRPENPACIIKQLKLSHADPKLEPIARRLFYCEAVSLEKLGRHDQIPLLLGYFEKDEHFYLVQDYIEGENLLQILTAETWTEADVLSFLRQMLSILAYVHSQNVIHRDIKPENIIRRSFDGRYVLIDFGSVKMLPDKLIAETQEKTRHLTVPVGTPGYMALEQKLGHPQPASDLYSLGVIAVEALVKVRYESVQRNWFNLVECSPKLKLILAKLVAENVSERWQSAEQVLVALDS